MGMKNYKVTIWDSGREALVIQMEAFNPYAAACHVAHDFFPRASIRRIPRPPGQKGMFFKDLFGEEFLIQVEEMK